MLQSFFHSQLGSIDNQVSRAVRLETKRQTLID